MEKKLVIFETEDGKCPFSDWLDNLRDKKLEV